MAYADYSFYTNTFLGNVIDSTSFNRVSERASEIIDVFTNGNITADILADTNTLTKIKKANCALAEQIFYGENSNNITSGGNVLSIKAGEETVTYKNSSNNTSYNSQKNDYITASEIISRYLSGTNLLYAGIV